MLRSPLAWSWLAPGQWASQLLIWAQFAASLCSRPCLFLYFVCVSLPSSALSFPHFPLLNFSSHFLLLSFTISFYLPPSLSLILPPFVPSSISSSPHSLSRSPKPREDEIKAKNLPIRSQEGGGAGGKRRGTTARGKRGNWKTLNLVSRPYTHPAEIRARPPARPRI